MAHSQLTLRSGRLCADRIYDYRTASAVFIKILKSAVMRLLIGQGEKFQQGRKAGVGRIYVILSKRRRSCDKNGKKPMMWGDMYCITLN
jgi:hypothetical protein